MTILTDREHPGKKQNYGDLTVKRNSTLYLTRGALIAAAYTVLTYLSAIFGLSSGVIQFRISEMLCILPVFMPEAVIGLTVGCLISNIISGAALWDIFFGSLATLIGALGARVLRMLPEKLLWLSTAPTVIANTFIIPLVLISFYGVTDAYFYLVMTVGIGELVCAGIGGTVLYHSIKKSKLF